MKKIMIGLSSLFALCCVKGSDFVTYSEAKFEALLENNDSIQLVDVRRADEYGAGHIEHATLIDVTASDFLSKADSQLDKSRPVAVYCRTGGRSLKAASLLSKQGYTVYNLEKGYMGWVRYQQDKKK